MTPMSDSAVPQPAASTEAASDDEHATARWEECVDQGSWQAFTPSLAQFLARSAPVMVLLTTPGPLQQPDDDATPRWRRLLGRRPAAVSDQPAGIIVTASTDSCQVDVPVLDERGATLVSPQARQLLTDLGWIQLTDVLSQSYPDCDQAASACTWILLEVFGLAHPADVDYLVNDSTTS